MVGDIFRTEDWQSSTPMGCKQGGVQGRVKDELRVLARRASAWRCHFTRGVGWRGKERPSQSFWVCRGWGHVKPSHGDGKQGARVEDGQLEQRFGLELGIGAL